jgi:thiol-disulfide isomerase/thioredoxin
MHTTPPRRRFALSSLLLLAAVVSQAPSARAGESEDWAAAMALKQQQKQREAAVAFDAIATKYPDSPRVGEALVEAGVSWFGLARGLQVLHRNPPPAKEAFANALTHFLLVSEGRASDPAAGRAQYMCGSVQLFLGDFAAAEQAYSKVLEKNAGDPKYASKSLERRAFVRRHRLDTAGELEDLRRYQREYPKGEEASSVARYLQLAESCGKPAPELDAESWVQGGPQSIAALRGEVVAVYFFATWCENCAKEKDFVADLHRRYEAQGLHWIGVIDHQRGQTAETVTPFLATEGYAFPVMFDHGKTIPTYLAAKIPELVLIDRLGRIRWHDTVANLADSTIETLLTEDPDKVPGAR